MAVESRDAGASSTGAGSGTPKTVWYRDQRTRAIITQIVVLALFIAGVWYIVSNTIVNLERLGITPGFGFMDQIAGFMPTSPDFNITGFDVNSSTHGDVFILGLVNTLLISFLGIILATIIGFIVGVLRLSKNVLVSFVASMYIEGTRNIPLLLQILFWYFAVILSMPVVRESADIGGIIFINNRYIVAPAPILGEGFMWFPISIVVAIVAIFFMARWAKKRQLATGQPFHTFWASLGILIGLPALALIATGFPITWDVPALKGFNFQGGVQITGSLMGLLIALTLYTAAFIAENVRAGIQSVSHGQTEAAYALGLKPTVTTNKIIIPQAMRVIVPPVTSQYLNLTKNSSLAVAIGYPDLVNVFTGISLNQTGNAVEIIALTMLVYLTFSLIISAIMNWYNKRVKLVER